MFRQPSFVCPFNKSLAKRDLADWPAVLTMDVSQMVSWHRLTCGQQFRRHRNIDRIAAFDAGNLDAPLAILTLMEMLLAKLADLPSPGNSLVSEFEN